MYHCLWRWDLAELAWVQMNRTEHREFAVGNINITWTPQACDSTMGECLRGLSGASSTMNTRPIKTESLGVKKDKCMGLLLKFLFCGTAWPYPNQSPALRWNNSLYEGQLLFWNLIPHGLWAAHLMYQNSKGNSQIMVAILTFAK